MNSEQTQIGAGSPLPSTPLFCAVCGSRTIGRHAMGCRVSYEREAEMLCNFRTTLYVLLALRDAVNGADAVAERQRQEAQNAGAVPRNEGGDSGGRA